MAAPPSVEEVGTPLGILAGGSGVPCEIAEAANRRGRAVHIVGLDGEAEPGIERYPHTWVNWGALGAMIRAFRDSGCREIVIIGRVRRPNLKKVRPDLVFWQSLPALLPILRGGDDAILRLVVRFFERHGLTVVGVQQAAPELLATDGVLGRIRPDVLDLESVATCARALAALGPFDAAQAAVGKGSRVIGVEGADGTDALLRRLGPDASGAVLVKLPKAGQERRIDLPAIGPETIRLAVEAGLAGIAVRSGETLVAERRISIEKADAEGLFLVGVPASLEVSASPTAEYAIGVEALKPASRRLPRAGPLADVALGAQVLGALDEVFERASVVVSRGYVLGTEGPGGALGLADRAGRLKPWGTRLMRRRVGVLVMSDIAGELGFEPEQIVERARRSGLAGLVVLRSATDERAMAALRSAIDRAGLFLLMPGDAI